MPISSITFTAHPNRILATQTISIDASRIRSVSALNISGGVSPTDAIIEIGIMSGGTTQGHRAIILNHGHVGDGAGIFWHGDILGSPEEYVYANVVSTAGGIFKLATLARLKE